MSNYTRHYDIPLLDELHNYFPEILYGAPDRFQTVPDLLNYIRSQVRDRFDLFTAGQRGWRQQSQQQPQQQQPQSRVPGHLAAPSQHPVRIRTTFSEPAQRLLGLGGVEALGTVRMPAAGSPVPTATAAASSLLDLFTAAFIPTPLESLMGPLPTGFAEEPVIVRPTVVQIAENTTIEIMDAEEDVCAICQDDMRAGTEVRALDACDHRFHVGCIDTWFERDVHCPICRHDVREPAEEAAAAAAAMEN